MPATYTKSSAPAVSKNNKKAKASKSKAVLADISKSATADKVASEVPETVEDNKGSAIVNINKAAETVSPVPTSGVATPESTTSSNATLCAGGQAALLASDADDNSSPAPGTDATPSSVAKALRKQLEKSKSSHIVGAVVAPRNMKRTKKGRVPLTKLDKKNHNDFRPVTQECDRILSKFAKEKRASRSVSPDSSIWQATNLFFTGLPAPVDDGEAFGEDENLIDMPGFVSKRPFDEFEEDAEQQFIDTSTSPVDSPEATATDESFEDDISDMPSLTDGRSSSDDGETSTSPVIKEVVAGLPNTDIMDSLSECDFLDEDELDEVTNGKDNIPASGDDQPPVAEEISDDATQSANSPEEYEQLSQHDVVEEFLVPEPVVEESSLDFLSFPDKAEHPPMLSRDEEIALIKNHVTPLVVASMPKKLSRAEEKTEQVAAASPSVIEAPIEKKPEVVGEPIDTTPEEPATADDVPSISAEQGTAVASLPAPEVAMPKVYALPTKWLALSPVLSKKAAVVATREIATLEDPVDPEVIHPTPEQVSQDTLAPALEPVDSAEDPLDDVQVVAEEEAPTPIEVIKDTYMGHFLSMPNGSGQDVVARQQEADLVALHVLPYVEPPVQKHGKKANKAKKIVKKSIDNGNKISFSSDESTYPPAWPKSRRSSLRTCSSSHHSDADLERNAVIARNTFLGITSLEDFIVQLVHEGSDTTTTKKAVCKAFATLAAEEFESLTGLSPTIDVSRASASSIEQRKIKLGKTTLHKFLRGIAFDDESVTHTRTVMRAFKEAAKVSDKPSEMVLIALRSESETSS
jgi:hypothetical protein